MTVLIIERLFPLLQWIRTLSYTAARDNSGPTADGSKRLDPRATFAFEATIKPWPPSAGRYSCERPFPQLWPNPTFFANADRCAA